MQQAKLNEIWTAKENIMVTKESKLFTHLSDIACEIAAPRSVKMIWKLLLVRRMAWEPEAGLTDVLPSRVNPLSNRWCPEVPPMALTLSDSQNSCRNTFRKSKTTRKAETTCTLQLKKKQRKSSREGPSQAPLLCCRLSGPKPSRRGRKWQMTQADFPLS